MKVSAVHSVPIFLALLGRKVCCFTKVSECFTDIRHEEEENSIEFSNRAQSWTNGKKKFMVKVTA